jgi:hypothetical protein
MLLQTLSQMTQVRPAVTLTYSSLPRTLEYCVNDTLLLIRLTDQARPTPDIRMRLAPDDAVHAV